MQPLTTNKQILIWLSAYPVDETNSKWKKIACGIFSVLVFFGNLSALAASVAYFMKFMSIDLGESLCALLQISGFGSSLFMMLIAVILRHKIKNIFEQLSEIYEMSKPNR